MELLIRVKKDKTELVLKKEDERRRALISSKRLLRDLFLELEKMTPVSQRPGLKQVKVEKTEDSSQMSFRIAKAFREGFLVNP